MTQLLLAETAALSDQLRRDLEELWQAAFTEFTDDDRDHAYGGVHAVLLDGTSVVAHASVVHRTILVGEQPFSTGYVEAVATLPARQGEGLGRRVMVAVGEVVRWRYEFGALATGSPGFYERLGWECWHGPSYLIRDGERVRTEEDDDALMVLRFGPSAGVDLSAPIACFDRSGDVW